MNSQSKEQPSAVAYLRAVNVVTLLRLPVSSIDTSPRALPDNRSRARALTPEYCRSVRRRSPMLDVFTTTVVIATTIVVNDESRDSARQLSEDTWA